VSESVQARGLAPKDFGLRVDSPQEVELTGVVHGAVRDCLLPRAIIQIRKSLIDLDLYHPAY
jgi:hypothetical protein